FLFFLPAILGAAWLWGVWAGTLALLLSALAADLFMEPLFHLSVPTGDQAFSMGVFIALGAFLIFAAEVARRARGESEAGKEMLDQALRSAKMSYWSWEVASGRVSWSDNLEAIHGLPPGSFGATLSSFLDRIHPEDAPRVKEAIERAAREGADFDLDYRGERTDGGGARRRAVFSPPSSHRARIPSSRRTSPAASFRGTRRPSDSSATARKRW